ncbi:hypothetical protein CERSUDRAFT_96394 [Gelatoporia subvermispora B]|uniref:Uncharacterized protein n=1 Tax=Ceriporiopsis subvermispora (strain B) TaxID=914234 RepID=M2PGU9_CERS8|nr:hypothetical protein CERSUDRAFT_96394 [Gelatoporia subvermispora B]
MTGYHSCNCQKLRKSCKQTTTPFSHNLNVFDEDPPIPDTIVNDELYDKDSQPLFLLLDAVLEGSAPLLTYSVSLADKDGTKWHNIAALFDMGAGPSYMKPSMACRIKAEIYPITSRRIQGAGETTTSAFARFRICISMIVGHNFLKHHNAMPNWREDAWIFTDPQSGLSTKVLATNTTPNCVTCSERSHDPITCHVIIDKEEKLLHTEPEPAQRKTCVAKLKAFMKKKFGPIFRKKVGYPPQRK